MEMGRTHFAITHPQADAQNVNLGAHISRRTSADRDLPEKTKSGGPMAEHGPRLPKRIDYGTNM